MTWDNSTIALVCAFGVIVIAATTLFWLILRKLDALTDCIETMRKLNTRTEERLAALEQINVVRDETARGNLRRILHLERPN